MAVQATSCSEARDMELDVRRVDDDVHRVVRILHEQALEERRHLVHERSRRAREAHPRVSTVTAVSLQCLDAYLRRQSQRLARFLAIYKARARG